MFGSRRSEYSKRQEPVLFSCIKMCIVFLYANVENNIYIYPEVHFISFFLWFTPLTQGEMVSPHIAQHNPNKQNQNAQFTLR